MESIYSDLQTAWPNIAIAWGALLLLVMSPGPTVMAIMGVSMAHGPRAGYVFTTGCMTGASFWAVLAGLGLSAWLTSFSNALTFIKILGSIYLLWMSYSSFKSALRKEISQNLDISLRKKKHLFSRGLALDLTNPKAILSWAAVITLSQAETGSHAVLFFTLASCLLITYAINFTYATVFASKTAMLSYAKARRIIEVALGSVFGYAGLRLFADEHIAH